MIRMGRRGSRSTHTPAGNPISANGSNCRVARAPTCNAEACSQRMATIGKAKPVT